MEASEGDPLPMMELVLSIVQVPYSELFFTVFILLILLLLSGLVSSSEVAFFSLKKPDLEEMSLGKGRSEKLVVKLMEKPKAFLASLLIANNFINITIVVISFYMLTRQLDISSSPILAFVIQTVVITFLLVMFGEIIPKVYATKFPKRLALRMSRLLYIMNNILKPFSKLLVVSSSFLDKRLATKSAEYSIEELTDAIELTYDVDADEDEKDILKGIVTFGEIEVRQIMKPRQDIAAIQLGTSAKEMLSMVRELGFSRIPVYEDSLDKIEGVLYVKDILPYLDDLKNLNWPSLVRQAFFVPDNKKIDDLFREFQSKRTHIAIVVDEYGGCEGLVTLEDILEEVVGEIRDEFDEEDIIFEELPEGHYVFEGKTLLTDVIRIMNLDRSELEGHDEETESLAGLVLEIAKDFPSKGQAIHLSSLRMQVLDVDARRIKKIEIWKEEAEEQLADREEAS